MPFITVSSLAKSYPVGGTRLSVLKGLELTLERGEMLKDREARMRARDGSVKDVLIDSSAFRKDGRLVNSIIHTYPKVSQFWTYDPKAFLANPVYSRDFPPCRHC